MTGFLSTKYPCALAFPGHSLALPRQVVQPVALAAYQVQLPVANFQPETTCEDELEAVCVFTLFLLELRCSASVACLAASRRSRSTRSRSSCSSFSFFSRSSLYFLVS